MTIIHLLPPGDVQAAQAVVNQLAAQGEPPHPLLQDLRRDVFYGGWVWVAYRDGSPVALTCGKPGKRKKNAWEPYLNWYTAYTCMAHRRLGYATTLYRRMEAVAQATTGCRRVKSLAGSSAGLGLHLSLGHACWGLTANNEVWVDSPLPGHDMSCLGHPPQAPQPTRMSAPDIRRIIKKGLRYDQQQKQA